METEKRIVSLAYELNQTLNNEDYHRAKGILTDIYQIAENSPEILINLNGDNSFLVGNSFLTMLEIGLTNDYDLLQSMASLSYFLLNHSIKLNAENELAHFSRIKLFELGIEDLAHTFIKGLEINDNPYTPTGSLARMKGKEEIEKLLLCDLIRFPNIFKYFPNLKNRQTELIEKITNGNAFLPKKSQEEQKEVIFEIMKESINVHKKMYNFLKKKFIKNRNINF